MTGNPGGPMKLAETAQRGPMLMAGDKGIPGACAEAPDHRAVHLPNPGSCAAQ